MNILASIPTPYKLVACLSVVFCLLDACMHAQNDVCRFFCLLPNRPGQLKNWIDLFGFCLGTHQNLICLFVLDIK